MRRYVADLHVHTVLSPCAAVEMTPRNIILHAAAVGIDIVAITDHNAGDNVPAALAAAAGTGVTVLPGMEVETREEVHLIVLFDQLAALREWQRLVEANSPYLVNDAARFGAQFVVDAEDNLLEEKERLLLTSLKIGVAETVTAVSSLGGLCIAAHIDRPSYSILSQLGFVPDDLSLAAVEVSGRVNLREARGRFPQAGKLPFVTASDAHTIDDFIRGPKTVFLIEQPTLAELRQALYGQNQRKVVVV
ncbi:PHP domain-containing protein [Sporolituus thermophilus]|uniref:Polymerase/histidinol phosphatase N-terminal domain-containing protein n=1 Tax=Sporolituus thermophilus DSM 23256 TaxID=1123285 RepID=A0A1G7J5W4_9FIRM|nr:PHP domain-containing protein [Sporolituus thermophilus]SDF20271.1 hypothetical protein SAMN05660235_00776 [Sporolituus thermophilus DSM 23256]